MAGAMNETFVAFLAHPKSIEDIEIVRQQQRALEALRAAIAMSPGGERVTPYVVTGRDDFNARVWECGGWDGWTKDVAQGRAYRNGALGPRFDTIIVAPSPQIGKGTMALVKHALNGGKPVYLLTEEGRLQPVRDVATVDPTDFQAGWIVE